MELSSEILIAVVREWLPIALPTAGPFAPGLQGWPPACCVWRALPCRRLWHLPAQSPLAVLRRDTPIKAFNAILRGFLGVLAVALLLVWYSNNVILALAILLGFALTAASSIGVGLLLLRLGKTYGHWMGSIWRLALSNLWRRKNPA